MVVWTGLGSNIPVLHVGHRVFPPRIAEVGAGVEDPVWDPLCVHVLPHLPCPGIGGRVRGGSGGVVTVQAMVQVTKRGDALGEEWGAPNIDLIINLNYLFPEFCVYLSPSLCRIMAGTSSSVHQDVE